MSYIGRSPYLGDYAFLDDISPLFDGARVRFPLSLNSTATAHDFDRGQRQPVVRLNGVELEYGIGYYLEEFELIFFTAPQSGDICIILSLGEFFDRSNDRPLPTPSAGDISYLPFTPTQNPYIPPESGYVYYVADGSSIGVFGSGAAIQDGRLYRLYLRLWSASYTSISGSGTKGASAEQDWQSGKVLNVPQFASPGTNQTTILFSGSLSKIATPYTIQNQVLTADAQIGQLAWFLIVPGDEWLPLDGSSIPDGEAYDELRSKLGTTVLPNIDDRFLLNSYDLPIGATGGASSVALTVNEMPAHNHPTSDPGHRHQEEGTKEGPTNTGTYGTLGNNDISSPQQSTSRATTGITVNNRGGGQPHENMPPYFSARLYVRARK